MNRYSDNQRQSYRFPVNAAKQECALRIGDAVLPGVLVNESAGGFGVLVGRSTNLSASQTLELRTLGGWFQVEVIRIAEIEPPEPLLMAEESGPWFELGLRRIREMPVDEPVMTVLAVSLRSWLGEWIPSGGSLFLLGVFLVLSIVVVPLGIGLASWYGTSPARHPTNRHVFAAETATPAALPRSRPEKPFGSERKSSGGAFKTSGFNRNASAFGEGDGRADRPKQVAPRVSADRRAAIRNLPGAKALVLPDVAVELCLSDRQRRQIQQIIDATDEAVRKVAAETQPPGEDRDFAARREALLDDSRRRAWELLTDEQRERWAEILSEARR